MLGGIAWLWANRPRLRKSVVSSNGPPQQAPLPPDRRVGRYQIQQIVADGGTATVYEALDPDGDKVALKVPHANHLSSKEFIQTFHREASIGETLRHPSIVTVLEVGEYSAGRFRKIPYFVMEFLEGQDLQHVIRQRGQLPAREAAQIARAIADALEWAHHRGVNHRDVTPRNIFLTRQKTVKVMDFGISTVTSRVSHKSSNALMLGTPEYLAPERIRNPRSNDPRSDLYSLGCIFYEMLSGHPPYPSDDPREALRLHCEAPLPSPPEGIKLPAGMWPIVKRLLEKDPTRRYQSAGEVISALADLSSLV